MAPAEPLDELLLTVVVDNETDTLSSIDPGVPQLPEVASLLGRLTPCREHDGHAGYHLAGAAMEDRIPDTVTDLAELVDPRIVAPGHCTGWRAKAALAARFAPGRYGPSVVGSLYVLSAEDG